MRLVTALLPASQQEASAPPRLREEERVSGRRQLVPFKSRWAVFAPAPCRRNAPQGAGLRRFRQMCRQRVLPTRVRGVGALAQSARPAKQSTNVQRVQEHTHQLGWSS